jgi:membrane protein YqaA with SNARE-associated domain
MMSRLVAWVEKWAAHHHATKALALVSFVEASVFPIPPFVLIIGMLSLEKKLSWVRLAAIGAVSSVLGGILGYIIGHFLYAYIGSPLVAFYGIGDQVTHLGQLFQDHVFWTIILASLSPIPYKVFTLSAGLFSVNLPMFIFASLIGRGIRFLVVSYVADRYGVRAKRFVVEQQKKTIQILCISIVVMAMYYFLFRK